MPPALQFRSLLTGVALLLIPFGSSRADLITDWNSEALSAMKGGTESPFIARDLAILHTAIYNAAESIQGNYQTYGFGSYTAPGSGPAGASIEAAIASAANTVMQSLYAGSGSGFTTLYNSQLSTIADSQAKTDGIAWGQTIANDILSWRATDGSSAAAATAYSPVGTVGYWQQTSAASPLLPGWKNVSTFAIPGTSSFTSTLPGASLASYVQTAQYAADFNEVKELGAQFSLTRTADQTNQAYFWSGVSGTVTVPGMWNQVAGAAADSQGLSLTDTARLFAAVNVAMADAGITAWADAYNVQFWRPESAIANGGDSFFDTDGNPSTQGDVFWLPLIDSPTFPEYVAANSAFSEAATTVLASFLGDSVAFSLGSDIDGNGSIDLTRNFTSFSQASAEAGQSTIYAGTQFGTSVTDGATLGASVGTYVLNNNFAVVPEPSAAVLALLGAAMFGLRRRRSA